MQNLDHMLRGGPRDDDRDPQQRMSGAAFLHAQRHPAPGQWTDDPYQQSLHYTGTAFLALSRIVAAYGSVVATLERRKRQDRTTFSKSTFAVVKAVSPHGGAGNDEDYSPVYDHPLARLLESPNPQEAFGSLLGYMALQKGLTGEAPVWFVPNRDGRPVELYALQRALCQPQQPSALYPEGFWRVTPYYASGTTWTYGTLGSRSAINAILPGEEVKRLLSPHPLTRLSGYSVFTACGIQMDVLEAIDKARHSHMMQGMLPGTIVYLPGLDQAGVDGVAASMQEKYAGAQKFRKPIVVGTDAAAQNGKPIVEQLTPNAVELDFQASWEQATKFVLAALDVLPTTAGITEGGGYAERYAARQEQHDRWQGGVKQAGDFFTHHLCRPWSKKPGEYRCKLVLPKIVNLERDVPSVSEMLQHDLILVNEARRLADMKPINGGDLPPSVWAKWVEKQSMPEPEPQPGADPNAQPPDGGTGAPAGDPLAALLGGDSPTGGALPQPDNPAGKGSLPPKPGTVGKARSARAEGAVWNVGDNWYTKRNGKTVKTKNPNAQPKGPTKKDEKATARASKEEGAARATAAAEKLAQGGADLTHDDVKHLDDHFATLPQAKMKEVAKAIGQKIGGTKAELAKRLIAHAKQLAAGGAAKVSEPSAAAPQPAQRPKPDAAPAKPSGAPKVTTNKNGDRTTQFAPGEPEAAAKKHGPAIIEAMNELKLDREFQDGIIPLGAIAHEVKRSNPDATDGDILAAVSHMRKTRQLEGHPLNEVQKLGDAKGGVEPLGGGKDADSATLWENGKAVHYFMLGKGAGAAAPAPKPASAAPARPAPPSPGGAHANAREALSAAGIDHSAFSDEHLTKMHAALSGAFGGGAKPGAKPAGKPKAGAPELDAKHHALRDEIAGAVKRAKADPHSVTDEETDAMIGRVRKMPPKQAQALSAALTGSAGKTGQDAAIRIRSALASVRQNLNSQNA